MPIKHCLIKEKEEFTIRQGLIKQILMDFHRKTCSKIITPITMVLTLVEVEIKIWVDSNLFSKIFLVRPLPNRDPDREENHKIKDKILLLNLILILKKLLMELKKYLCV